MLRSFTTAVLLMLTAAAQAQGVAPIDDERRIEVLIRARSEALQVQRETARVDTEALPPPVAEVQPDSVGIVAGPIKFEQLSKLQGRWISVRLGSGSVRRGVVVSANGNELVLRVGNGAQGASIPLNRKKIRSLELLP